jgi:hypothetical protein
MRLRDMPRILRRFRIDEISGVNFPAQKFADVRIIKRHQGDTATMNTQTTVEGTGKLANMLLELKTAELRKADPSLTEAQAYAKVYTDPENSEIQKAERRAARQSLYGGGSRADDGTVVARSAPVILNSMTGAEIKAWIIEERKRNPYLSISDVLAAIENSSASRAHRTALREQVADARRRGASNPTEDPVAKRDDALAEIDEAAEALRDLDPSLSKAQAFARAYKLNPALAKAERAAAREAIYS